MITVVAIIIALLIVITVLLVSVLGYVSDTNKKVAMMDNTLIRVKNIVITQLEQHYEAAEKDN